MKSRNTSKTIYRKAAAILLSFLMCVTLMPSSAFAEGQAADVNTDDVPETTAEDISENEDPAEDNGKDAIADEQAEEQRDGSEVVDDEEEADGTDSVEPETVTEETAADEVTDADVESKANLEQKDSFEGKVMLKRSNTQGVFVEATKSSIILHIGKVGTSGKAQIFRFSAENYYKTDRLQGLGSSEEGTIIAEYDCGTAADVECARYTTDGADHLYDKYYIIQNGEILEGPFYASEIESMNGKDVTPFEVPTKKGLTVEDSSTISQGLDMGISNTVINWDLCSMIYANEDSKGNPVDNSGKNAIKFKSNGETFYFNAQYIREQDGLISAYTKNNINVTLVVISWVQCLENTFPSSLRYDTGNSDRQTMAFNTSNERGRKYFIAAMEFLAKRYSDKDSAFVDQFIIGNEIDYTYDWCLIQPLKNSNGAYQKADFDIFMEEYARSLRLANLAVKKYNRGSKVLVSLTHNWAENCFESYGWGKGDANTTSTQTIRVNSYPPKRIVDWLVEQEGARGDYNWGLSVHPYPIGTTSSNPIKTDPDPSLLGSKAHPVNGNPDTSPWITVANLELYQLYLERSENQYEGETRTVSITEASICNKGRGSVSDEEYQKSILEQAASIAMMYYRAACIPCINEVAYFEYHDQTLGGNYNLGLVEANETEKPALNVWKYVDTNKSRAFSERYLKYISPDASSYRDIMDVTKTGYDWDKYWTDENLYPRTIGGDDQDRTITSDKTEYEKDEAIIVTATGNEGDRVCLYKSGENISSANPIYEYPVVGSKNGLSYYSGDAYNLCAYGTISSGRTKDAMLKAGDYVLVLQPGDGSDPTEDLIKDIKIKSDYSYGSKKYAVSTDKTEYIRGEDIIVSAFGKNSDSWVGIYKKGATPGSGGTSIYWYYCNAAASGADSEAISGKPTVLQTKKHENGTLNEPGEYVIYLFSDSGYNVEDHVDIEIKEMTGISPVTSLNYQIDTLDDGFANGVVTVTKNPKNRNNPDCIMYWAGADGKPLEGLGPLAEFKLTGATTKYRMHEYTLIPEGAKKLIAYGANGPFKSEEYVSYDLPEDCATLSYDEKPLAEFQIVSDIHVTTDGIPSGGETTLCNTHFSQMLEDTKKTSPNSLGIFIVGDIANNGRNEEYKQVQTLWQESVDKGGGNVPLIHLSMGNHDWYSNNPSKQFQKWVKTLNNTLEKQPDTVYYDEVIDGYHFIFLGGEERYDSLRASISEKQLKWFDNLMAKCTEEDPDKPVFVFLHQSFYNTVAGSLPGQGWDGVANEDNLKEVMEKYGQIILTNGHSHWDLNSDRCMYGGDDQAPAALNTASVGYLWSSYNITGGEFWDGSEGYTVKVYKDKVLFLGREYEQNVYLPSAMFVLQRDAVDTEKDEYNITMNTASFNLEAKSVSGGGISYNSEDDTIADVLDDGTVIAKNTGSVKIRMRTSASNTHIIGQKTVTVNISDKDVVRIFGKTRYETSLKTADEFKEQLGVDKFESVIIACGTNYADALAGSYLSCVRKAPILLVDGRNDHINAVKDYIQDNLKRGGTIYMLGGTAVVPDKAVTGLDGFKQRRLGGKDRYETNILILKEAAKYADEANEYMVCSGTGFPDSLSASATNRPIIMVKNDIQNSQSKYIDSLKGKKFYIVGGTGAVNEKIEQKFKDIGKTTRIGGATRYETSANVAKAFFDQPESAVLAYGANFPDGLCGGTLAYSMNGPLLLAANGKSDAAAEYANENGVVSGVILGGPTLINDSSAKNIFGLGPTAEIVEK